MARRAAAKRRSPQYSHGKKGFQEFLRQRCTITGCKTDVVRRCDLYGSYRKFCEARRYSVASVVNVGRHLGSLGVWASRRLGGARGRNQQYAYVGLYLHDDPDEEWSSPPARLASPSLPPAPSTGDAQPHCKDTPPSTSSPLSEASPSLSDKNLKLLESFLQEHVECTGSPDDAVAAEELHEAYRELCQAQGIRPPPSTKLSTHLAQQAGVAVSCIPFQSVKQAYLGLRWTGAAVEALNPSSRLQQTPCSFSETNSHTSTSPEVLWEGKEETDKWSPWVSDDSLRGSLYLSYWDYDDSKSFQDILQNPMTSPSPVTALPLTPPDTQDTDLYLLLDTVNCTDPSYMF